MDISQAMAMLKASAGNFCQIYVPSLKRELPFQQVTVGEMESVAKMMIEDPMNGKYIALTSLMMAMCREDLDMGSITEIDRMSILLQMKQKNRIGSDEFVIRCPKCEFEFNYMLGSDDLIRKLNEAKLIDVREQFQLGESEAELLIGYPSVQRNIAFKTYCSKILEKKCGPGSSSSDADASTIIHFLELMTKAMMIKDIFVNGLPMEGFASSSIDSQLELFRLFPGSLSSALNNGINRCMESFNLNETLTISLTCLKCSHSFFAARSTNDFFHF